MDVSSRGCSRRLLELSTPRASRVANDASGGAQSSSRRSTSASRRRGRWFEEFRTDSEKNAPAWGSSRSSMWEPRGESGQGLTLEVGHQHLQVFPPAKFKAPPRSAEPPEEELELEYVYGYSGDLHNQMHALDGTKVAYCAASVVVVMDVKLNKQTIFRGHDRRVTCLAINRQEDLAATGQGDLKSSGSCFCCVWQVADCTEVARLHLDASRFDAIEWSQDGCLLIACAARASSDEASRETGKEDRRYEEWIHIWNYAAPEHPLVKTFLLAEQVMGMRAHHTDSTRCAAYGAGHLTFFSYNPNNADALRIWTPRWDSNGPPQMVICTVYMPVTGEGEDYSLVLGTSSGEILVLQGDELRMKVQHSSSPVTFLQRTPSSICCGGNDGRLCFLNPSSLKPFVYFEMRQAFSLMDSTEDADICNAAVLVFILDGPRMTGSIVVGTDRNGLWLCNFIGSPQTLDVKPLTLFPGGKVSGLDSNPARSEEVVVATSRGIVRFFDVAERCVDLRRPFACDTQKCGGISCLAFDRAGLVLAIGCELGCVILLSTPFSQPAEDGPRACAAVELATTSVCQARITALCWSSQADWLVVGSEDGRIYLYCVAMDHAIDETPGAARVEVQTVILNDASPKVLDGNVAAVTSLQFSLNADWVMSNSADNQILFWETSSARLEKSGFVVRNTRWYGHVEPQDADEDGAAAAQSSWRSPLGWPVAGLWTSGTQGSRHASGIEAGREVHSVQSSPSSMLCAFGDESNRVSLGRFPATRPDTKIKSYYGHGAKVTNVTWTSDDSILTTAGEDGVMLQWHVLSPKSPPKPVPDRGDKSEHAAALDALLEFKVEAEKRRKTPLQPRGSRASQPIPSNAHSQSRASASSFQRRQRQQSPGAREPNSTPQSSGRNPSLNRQNSVASATSRASSPGRQPRVPFQTQGTPRPSSPRRGAPEKNSSRAQSPYPRSRAASHGQTKQSGQNRQMRKSGSFAQQDAENSVGRHSTRFDRPSSPRGRSASNSTSRISSPSPRRTGQTQEHQPVEVPHLSSYDEVPQASSLVTRSVQTEHRSVQSASREHQTIEQPIRLCAQDVWDVATQSGSDTSSATQEKPTTNIIGCREDLGTKRGPELGCYMPPNIYCPTELTGAIIYAPDPENHVLVTSGSDTATVSTVAPSITPVTSASGHAVSNGSGQAPEQAFIRREVTRSYSGPTVLQRLPSSSSGSLIAAPGAPQRMSSQGLLTGSANSDGISSVPVPQLVTKAYAGSAANDMCQRMLQQPKMAMQPGPSRLQRSSSVSSTPLSTRTSQVQPPAAQEVAKQVFVRSSSLTPLSPRTQAPAPQELQARAIASQMPQVPQELAARAVGQPPAQHELANPLVIRSSSDTATPLSARATTQTPSAPHLYGRQFVQRSNLDSTAPLSARALTSGTHQPQELHALLRNFVQRSTTNEPAKKVVTQQLVHRHVAENVGSSMDAAQIPQQLVARTPSEENLLRDYRQRRALPQSSRTGVPTSSHVSAAQLCPHTTACSSVAAHVGNL